MVRFLLGVAVFAAFISSSAVANQTCNSTTECAGWEACLNHVCQTELCDRNRPVCSAGKVCAGIQQVPPSSIGVCMPEDDFNFPTPDPGPDEQDACQCSCMSNRVRVIHDVYGNQQLVYDWLWYPIGDTDNRMVSFYIPVEPGQRCSSFHGQWCAGYATDDAALYRDNSQLERGVTYSCSRGVIYRGEGGQWWNRWPHP